MKSHFGKRGLMMRTHVFILYLYTVVQFTDYFLGTNVHGVLVYNTEQVKIQCFCLDYLLKHILLDTN